MAHCGISSIYAPFGFLLCKLVHTSLRNDSQIFAGLSYPGYELSGTRVLMKPFVVLTKGQFTGCRLDEVS